MRRVRVKDFEEGRGRGRGRGRVLFSLFLRLRLRLLLRLLLLLLVLVLVLPPLQDRFPSRAFPRVVPLPQPPPPALPPQPLPPGTNLDPPVVNVERNFVRGDVRGQNEAAGEGGEGGGGGAGAAATAGDFPPALALALPTTTPLLNFPLPLPLASAAAPAAALQPSSSPPALVELDLDRLPASVRLCRVPPLAAPWPLAVPPAAAAAAAAAALGAPAAPSTPHNPEKRPAAPVVNGEDLERHGEEVREFGCAVFLLSLLLGLWPFPPRRPRPRPRPPSAPPPPPPPPTTLKNGLQPPSSTARISSVTGKKFVKVAQSVRLALSVGGALTHLPPPT